MPKDLEFKITRTDDLKIVLEVLKDAALWPEAKKINQWQNYYLGHGLLFLSRFWYLTVYYLIPWILFPALAIIIDRRAAGKFLLTANPRK